MASVYMCSQDSGFDNYEEEVNEGVFELWRATIFHDAAALRNLLGMVSDEQQQATSMEVEAANPNNLAVQLPWYINYTDPLGNTVLHAAVTLSDFEATRFLIERGANVGAKDSCNRTPLHLACGGKSMEIVQFLTERSPAGILKITDSDGETPLDRACKLSTPQIVQFLLLRGSSVIARERENGPLINATFNEPEYATAIVSMLLDAGANIHHQNIQGETALISAVRQSEKEMMNARDRRQRSAYLDLCSLLINRGSDLEMTDNFLQTVLHVAVDVQNESIVRSLIVSRCDINKQDVREHTPLFIAYKKGNKSLVDLLISCGANLKLHLWLHCINSNENDKENALLFHIISKCGQCLSLQEESRIAVWKYFRNLENLGLPPRVMKQLNLED